MSRTALYKQALPYGERYVQLERQKGANPGPTAAGIFAEYLASEAHLRRQTVAQVIERLWPELRMAQPFDDAALYAEAQLAAA